MRLRYSCLYTGTAKFCLRLQFFIKEEYWTAIFKILVRSLRDRGISLLSIAGKILAKILLNRLNVHLDQTGLIPESQCGFRKARGTIDMIFTARQLQEKCQEQNVDLYMTFIDLTKAFDTVSRDGLWKIMAKFGCPPRYIAMVRQFHDGTQARIQNDGEYSEPFPVTNGVKQGCVMAPTLFSMMFSAMLTDAFQDVDAGFPIRYRFDGKLLNLRTASQIQGADRCG